MEFHGTGVKRRPGRLGVVPRISFARSGCAALHHRAIDPRRSDRVILRGGNPVSALPDMIDIPAG